MQILFILLLVLVVLDIVAWKWGVDSRSRTDRQERKDAWIGSQETRSATLHPSDRTVWVDDGHERMTMESA